ncbi:MAG TPA: hypothetical protein PKZ76_13605, partial [Xanthomonadaceae bacterium]|nr:hypothetical protein [Xanthomonadaceae bacterium]
IFTTMFGGMLTGGAAGIGAGGAGAGAAGMMGGAAGSAGLMSSIAVAIPIIGWIVAGMLLNDSFYQAGWRRRGGTLDLPDGQQFSGGGLGTFSMNPLAGAGAPLVMLADSFLQSLGLNERWASILSGSSVLTRAWGHKAPELEGLRSTFRIGEGGADSDTQYRVLERGGWFRSDRRSTVQGEPMDEATRAAQDLFDDIEGVMARAARQLRGTLPAMIDAALTVDITYDKKGEETARTYFVEVLGRVWEEATQDSAVARLHAEAIIATIDAIMGVTVDAVAAQSGRFVSQAEEAIRDRIERGGDDLIIDKALEEAAARQGEASAIAERWRDDAETLLAGAQFLLQAAVDVRRGLGLLGDEGTLTQITDLVERLALHGESMIDAYQRLVVSTALYETALLAMGSAFDGSREALVEFAADITNAAGGIERALSLWKRFFETFYTPEEMFHVQLIQARGRASTLLEDLGIDAGVTPEEFRALFEEALPTLSAEAIVVWLEAASALADVIDLENALSSIREDQAQALLAYAMAVRDLQDELDDARLSPFQQQVRDIARWAVEAEDNLHAAAQAAGMQAAAEGDLALVHQVAAQRVAQAIRQLQSAARSLAERLYGSEIDRIDAQIEALGGVARSHMDGIASVGQAADDMYRRQLQAIENIRQALDAQLLDPGLSTLTPEQRLAEARAQFEALAAAAEAGDVDAMQQLPQAWRDMLRMGADYWVVGSDQYAALESWSRGLLEQFADMTPTAPPPGSGGVGGSIGVSPELDQLYREREEALAAAELESRQAMAQELAVMMRDLMSATGDSLEQVAASIRISTQELLVDLGVIVGESTLENVLAMADVARLMGISMHEVADVVGVSLGELGDRQSLLNQALDATLGTIPEEFRERLIGPLEALRSAITETDVNDAMFDLLGVTDDLPAGIRDLLAPFFAEIDPSQVVTELGTLRSIEDLVSDQLDALSGVDAKMATTSAAAVATADGTWQNGLVLQEILRALEAQNREAGIPQYAAGGWVNGPTHILAGEAGRELVLPNPVSEFLVRAGIPVNAAGDMRGVERRLDKLVEITDRRLLGVEERLREVESAYADGAEKIANEHRRAQDLALSR